MAMRTDYLAEWIDEVLRSGKIAGDYAREAAERVLLSEASDDLHQSLSGAMSLVDVPARKVAVGLESFFVHDAWTPTESSHYELPSWPSIGYLRFQQRPPDGIVVRTVGRGQKYLDHFEAQWREILDLCPLPPDPNIRRIALQGSAANTRTRRLRVTANASAGVPLSGIELQVEQTFVARTTSGREWPLAAWTIGARMFFPTSGTSTARERVPVLKLDLLECTGPQDDAWSRRTIRAFAWTFARMARDALFQTGPHLANERSMDGEEWNVVFPFAIAVNLKPGMRSIEKPVHDALAALAADDAQGEDPMMDSHARIQWIDVCANDTDPGELDRRTTLATTAKAADRKASRSAQLPGEVYDLVEFEVREFCKGSDGLLYPRIFQDFYNDHRERFGESPSKTLRAYEIDASAFDAMGYDEFCREIRDRVASHHRSGDPEPEEMRVWFRHAIRISQMGSPMPAPPLVMRVLVDKATGAQAVDIDLTNSSPSSFLESATSLPSIPNPGQETASTFDLAWVTLCTPPKLLRVAKSLLERRPEIATWAQAMGVEIVHPNDGFATASIPRVWRADLPELFNGKGRDVAVLRRRLLQLCWLLNETQAGPERTRIGWRLHGSDDPCHTGQRGADHARFAAWRANILAAATTEAPIARPRG